MVSKDSAERFFLSKYGTPKNPLEEKLHWQLSFKGTICVCIAGRIPMQLQDHADSVLEHAEGEFLI